MTIRLTTLYSFAILLLFSQGICLAQSGTIPEKKNEGTVVRILCVQSLTGAEENVTLATKTEDGEWVEHGAVTLRSPFITPWIKVPSGVTHIVRKKGDEMFSIGSFKITPKLDRAILVMLPDTAKDIYRMQVINPAELGFQKGKALILNYGNVPAVVKMGKISKTVNPGQKVVQKIAADEDGMYRLVIGHVDKENRKIIPCYDRFVSSNPGTRKFILLFPDKDTGLRAMSLSEFGPFE